MVKQYKIITGLIDDMGKVESQINRFIMQDYEFHDLKVSATADKTRFTAILYKMVPHPNEA